MLVTVTGYDWVHRDDASDDYPLCMEGKVCVYDTETETDITKSFKDGLYIKNNLVWIGKLSQPGYFCSRFDMLEVVDGRNDI